MEIVERDVAEVAARSGVRDERGGESGGEPEEGGRLAARVSWEESRGQNERTDRRHAGEAAQRKQKQQPPRDVGTLIQREERGAADERRAADHDQTPFTPHLAVGGGHADEHREETEAGQHRHAAIRERAARDLERGRRGRRRADVFDGRKRRVDRERERALRLVAIDGRDRGPRDQVAAVADRAERHAQRVDLVAHQRHVVRVDAVPVHIEHRHVAPARVWRLAERDAHLRRRLGQPGVGCGVRLHVVRVRRRRAAHQDQDGRGDERGEEWAHYARRRDMAKATPSATMPMTRAAADSSRA